MTHLPAAVEAKHEEWERARRSGEIRLLYLDGAIAELREEIRTRVERDKPAPRLMPD